MTLQVCQCVHHHKVSNKYGQGRHHCPRVWVVLWLESETSPPWSHALNSWISACSILLRDCRNAGRWGLTARPEVDCPEPAFEAFPPYLALCFMASTMSPASATGSCGMNWAVSTMPSCWDRLRWDPLKPGAEHQSSLPYIISVRLITAMQKEHWVGWVSFFQIMMKDTFPPGTYWALVWSGSSGC